jgi:hypothetical protein
MEDLHDDSIGNQNEGDTDALAIRDDRRHEYAAFVMLEAQIVQMGEAA